MIVENIEKITTKDGTKLWKVSLEGDDKPLWLRSEPDFSKGHEIPDGSLQISQKGNSWNMKMAGATERKWQPKNDDDILLSVAFKGAIELERHHYVPAGKIDTGRIIQVTSELFAGLVLIRPQKEAK